MAVDPLIPHLTPGMYYDEPCVGRNDLVNHLAAYEIHVRQASDIVPGAEGIKKCDAFDIRHCWGECFITNPPWRRDILHPLIIHLSDIAPTWLLFDADWVHTKQSAAFMGRLRKFVTIGRVRWVPDSINTSMDNCAWHLFDAPSQVDTTFHGWSCAPVAVGAGHG